MFKRTKYNYTSFLLLVLIAGCSVPKTVMVTENKTLPAAFETSVVTDSTAVPDWRNFFTDKNLENLIDTALKNNQELAITLQDIEIAKNELLRRKGALLPVGGLSAGAGFEKVGRYTSQGAGDASTDIVTGKPVPDVLPQYNLTASASWDADIWKKLRTEKQASINRYLATTEGKNFVETNLVAEVANDYYELLALDEQLAIVRQTITLQKDALEIIKIQKEAARETELAVQKFQAEVLGTQSREFDLLQQVKETENKINFLLARFPQQVIRTNNNFNELLPPSVNTGIPSQLLANRPDIRQAELELTAAKLDVKAAHAAFYPTLNISAALGLQAFRPSYLVKLPESMLYSLGADFAAPLINRAAIKADFSTANAKQLQALYDYQRTVLNAYIEVANQLSNVGNLQKTYDLKSLQVEALSRSVNIANDLFKSARANYFEVLMTQRDALDAKLDLIATKKDQLSAVVEIYKNLGGGWK